MNDKEYIADCLKDITDRCKYIQLALIEEDDADLEHITEDVAYNIKYHADKLFQFARNLVDNRRRGTINE